MIKLKRLDEALVGSIVKYNDTEYYLMVCNPNGLPGKWKTNEVCLMWITDNDDPEGMLGQMTYNVADDPDWWLVDPKEMP